MRGTVFNNLRENKEVIKKLYWENEFPMQEIAKHFGCSRQSISKLSKELEINGVKTSSRCIREKHQGWKGGICKFPRNGIIITTGRNKQRLEHALIAEKILGRNLRKGEVVHHINGNNYDNRNENLLICTQSYHARFHHKMSDIYMREHFN